MRYLVTARVKPGANGPCSEAIEQKTLGFGSVAGDEYLATWRTRGCAGMDRCNGSKFAFATLHCRNRRPDWSGTSSCARWRCPCSPSLPRPAGQRAMGLRRLRLLGQTRRRFRYRGELFLELLRQLVTTGPVPAQQKI